MDYLILPHQLFDPKRFLKGVNKVILYEHPWYFLKFPYHKQKLIFHRAAMRKYQEELESCGIKVHYVNCWEKPKIDKSTHLFDPIDHPVYDEYHKICTIIESPLFLTKKAEVASIFEKDQHMSMASFYIYQRKKFDVMIQNGKPEGGKWSYDVLNRKKVPKGVQLPKTSPPKKDPFIEKIKGQIEKEFTSNPGSTENFYFAYDRKGASGKMDHFFATQFMVFGPYQDAILLEDPFTVHSVLSPYLNVGLLTVDEVLESALNTAAPLPSKEGFIRQILGWREFVRCSYELLGEKMMHSNFFHHKKELPKGFWDGKTDILPVDDAVNKAISFAYCHHIERLMVLGNYLLLEQTDPKIVYAWFMSFFIDAYDWVMVPNVFGMSQYADGGLITTKPYFSGSNYLLKMGNYPKGEWCAKFDDLFWNFIDKNQDFLESNPRLSMMVHLLKKRKSS
jgi:deoxyribodipyrimidine photolyase-related protein